MAASSLRLVPRRWRRLPPGKARLRLTLMYSALFMVLGAIVVAGIVAVAAAGGVGGSSSSAAPVGPGAQPGLQGAVAVSQHSADVTRLIVVSLFALLIGGGISTLLGWFAAGRVLRPLGEMATAARTITARNLHERLGIEGPEDEFKLLGDTMDDLLTRLESSFAAQRRFVANAAHELRTPLTVERTLLQVALADPDASAATLRATCEELLASGRDQERLLDSLLTLATSERGLVIRDPIDLASLVNRVLEGTATAAGERRLQVQANTGRADVLGDSALIERLVANLIENAVTYNQSGGSIRIDTGTKAERAFLSVANTGPVVAPEQVERLFEPFERLEPERTGSAGRHGLGLSIVRAIATAHDAEVTAEPRSGGGLIVTVSFPPAP
jgi:signal transduction histidine kinase